MFDAKDRVEVASTMGDVQAIVNALVAICKNNSNGNEQVVSTTITQSVTGDIRISQRVQRTAFFSLRGL